MFTDFFSWCTSLGEKIQNGSPDVPETADYYSGYFADSSVCDTVFWTGAIIAVVIALLFYFGICNYVFKLAKRSIWVIVAVLVFGITFFVNIPQIVGHDADDPEDATGIFAYAYNMESELLDGTEDDDAREEIQQTASDFRELFLPKEDSIMMRESLPMEMALANACYAVVLFILLSFLFKRHTAYGSAIPL